MLKSEEVEQSPGEHIRQGGGIRIGTPVALESRLMSTIEDEDWLDSKRNKP
jgi:hypothetical protein